MTKQLDMISHTVPVRGAVPCLEERIYSVAMAMSMGQKSGTLVAGPAIINGIYRQRGKFNPEN